MRFLQDSGPSVCPAMEEQRKRRLKKMFIFNKKSHDEFNLTSPILMVSAADLKEALRGIFEEFIVAGGEKEDELLTVRQASALLGVDRSTLWRWEKEGYLRPIRIGRKVRYQLSAVNVLKKGSDYGRRA